MDEESWSATQLEHWDGRAISFPKWKNPRQYVPTIINKRVLDRLLPRVNSDTPSDRPAPADFPEWPVINVD